MAGSLEQAKLFVANTDARIGLRRNRAAKRAAVLLVLGTERGAGWGDREIARHCDVSHTFVATVRVELTHGIVANAQGHGNQSARAERADLANVKGNGSNKPDAEADNVAKELDLREDSGETSSADGARELDERQTADANESSGLHPTLDEAREDPGLLVVAPVGPGSEGVAGILAQLETMVAGCSTDDLRRDLLSELSNAIAGMLDGLDLPSEGDEPLDEHDGGEDAEDLFAKMGL